MQHCWPFPSSQQIKAAFASMSNMTNNRTLSSLMQNSTPELKQLKDTTNLLDNNSKQAPALPGAQAPAIQTTSQLLSAAQLAAQNSQLPIQPTLSAQEANNQSTTNQQQQLTKETNGQHQAKPIKVDQPVLLNSNNVSDLINNATSNLKASKKEEVEDINIEDDEPTIEDEEIDAVDDVNDSGEDDSTTLKMKLKQQQQQQRHALRRSAFSDPRCMDPKLLSTNLAKFQSQLNSNNMISAALSQLVNTKQVMAAAVASLTGHYGPDSPPSGSLKSPNSTASATTLPSDDSPNSSFNSISIAGSLKKRRKYSSYSIAEILHEPADV